MKTTDDRPLSARIQNLEAMPAMPAVLASLLRYLELPPDQIEVEKVAELVSADESIAAQCLRLANSALFLGHVAIETVRGAVVALGARRLRDILWSAFLIRLTPKNSWPFDPAAFWEHSFGCALVSQNLARKLALPDPEKIYLCGLLHDLGELVNATLLPDEFRSAAELAVREGISLFGAEREVLGFTHCDTGKLLADRWNLAPDNQSVIEFHHTPEQVSGEGRLVALVSLADLLCRLRGMGYGYEELGQADFGKAPAWEMLAETFPQIERLDLARLAFELDAEADEIRELVTSTFRR